MRSFLGGNKRTDLAHYKPSRKGLPLHLRFHVAELISGRDGAVGRTYAHSWLMETILRRGIQGTRPGIVAPVHDAAKTPGLLNHRMRERGHAQSPVEGCASGAIGTSQARVDDGRGSRVKLGLSILVRVPHVAQYRGGTISCRALRQHVVAPMATRFDHEERDEFNGVLVTTVKESVWRLVGGVDRHADMNVMLVDQG